MYRSTQTGQNIRFDAWVVSIRLIIATLSTFSAANPAGLRRMTCIIDGFIQGCDRSPLEAQLKARMTLVGVFARRHTKRFVILEQTLPCKMDLHPLPPPQIDLRALPPTQYCTQEQLKAENLPIGSAEKLIRVSALIPLKRF